MQPAKNQFRSIVCGDFYADVELKTVQAEGSEPIAKAVERLQTVERLVKQKSHITRLDLGVDRVQAGIGATHRHSRVNNATPPGVCGTI